MLSGKQYNNAVRISKYSYNAICRLRVEHFESWLLDNGYGGLSNLITRAEFKDFLRRVSIFILSKT